MLIKVSRTILESAVIFQAKHDARYYLGGICFKSDGRVCSTDGHRMFIGSKHSGELKEDIVIKVSKSPVRAYDHAIIDTESEIVSYFTESAVKVAVGKVSVVDGRFPDVDRVIPKERNATDIIAFNAGYLTYIEKVAKNFNNKMNSVVFELNGNAGAAVAKFTSPFAETGMVIIMPMRV